MKERLDAIGSRIERLSLDPDQIESHRLFRVVSPLFALAGWRAHVKHAALRRLVKALGARPGADRAEPKADLVDEALRAAVRELEETVSTLERVAILRRRPPVAHAAWARRAWELVVTASHATTSEARRRAASTDAAALLPPLAVGRSAPAQPGASRAAETSEAPVPTREPELPESDADGRLVELELAAIDHLLAAAREERNLLGRKRRLLVAARQRLLEAAAALTLDAEGVRARTRYLAREIARVDRFESAGVSSTVGLVHQARLAIDRGDPRLAYAALAALDGNANASGDVAVATLTERAIGRLWTDGDPNDPTAREASLQRSATDLLGADVVKEVTDAIERARQRVAQRAAPPRNTPAELTFLNEREHFCAGAELEVLRSSVAVDGCFEVGGALAPVRIVEEERVLAEVRHPTTHLTLVPARDAEDLGDAIIGDPRTLLLDLAAGRLLTRRFVRDVARPKTRIVMKSEVRVYVLDGSGSMKGPRARVRDALLVAELATMVERLRAPGTTRCTLYYRYFDEELGPVTRVDGVGPARRAIRDVVGRLREGGTDIQKALVASLAQVQEARELDPDLARAQVVLVTDGEADVDEAAILAARAEIDGVPIGVSVIALGQENPALRAIVARQRARGEPAFYHYLADDELASIAAGSLDRGLPVHLGDAPRRSAAVLAGELEREIGSLVDELASIERTRDLASREELDDEAQARREAGLDPSPIENARAGDEGVRARAEAVNRDRRALEARFARWFPAPAARATSAPGVGTPEHDDVEAVTCALASVAEVIVLLGGSELARRADAIDLLERLLPDARVSPARYRAVLRDWPGAVAGPLGAIHAAVSV